MEYLTYGDIERGKKNGLSYPTMQARVHSYNWDKERAVTEPVVPRGKRNRKHDKRHTDQAKRNGINMTLFYARVGKGMDPELASTMPPMTNEESGRLSAEKRWGSEGHECS